MPKKIMKFIEIKNFTEDLISWQREQGRHHLPWQKNRTAYRVWLSEIMLQQTQVSTVVDRYQLFLKRFPNIHSLAEASVDDVLAEWSGMGYYTRARNLHKCAQVVVAEYGGDFPSDPELLERLPGIGKSTAAAIAVFSYGARAAILDGNVKRVLARLWGVGDDLSKSAAVKSLWAHAENLLPSKPRDLVSYTQGLMDFGATHCTQYQPVCMSLDKKECLFQNCCQAKLNNKVDQIPLKVKKINVQQVEIDWWIYIYKGKVLLEKRPESGIWASLWSFPEQNFLIQKNAKKLNVVRHVLTHRHLKIQPYKISLSAMPKKTQANQMWVSLSDALKLGLPKPVSSFLQNQDLVHDVV
jgi:A/G-specific adenine glycosylase